MKSLKRHFSLFYYYFPCFDTINELRKADALETQLAKLIASLIIGTAFSCANIIGKEIFK